MRHLVLLGACGDDGGSTSSTDAPASAIDAALDAPAVPTCTGACRTTALTATESTLHVEAYKNAAAGCPTSSSPTPDYTMILGKVGIASAGASPGNLLDFQGDLLDGALGAAATAVTLTTVAIDVCPTCVGMPAPADADGFAAIDASLTFAAGTIAGHLFATHCDTLDDTP